MSVMNALYFLIAFTFYVLITLLFCTSNEPYGELSKEILSDEKRNPVEPVRQWSPFIKFKTNPDQIRKSRKMNKLRGSVGSY